MQGYARGTWRPAPRMSARALAMREQYLGIPGNFVWGAAGFVTGLGGSVVVDYLLPDTPVPSTILGPLAAAVIGGLLFWNAKQPHRAIPWAIGAATPAVVQMVYGMLYPARAAS